MVDTPQAAVTNPRGNDPLDPNSLAPDGFVPVLGILDGLAGATRRISTITDFGAEAVGNVTEARRSIFELRADEEAFEQDQFIELAGFQRGDNLTQYYVFGAVAVAVLGVVLISR